jgi:hypothetical protein
MCFVSIFYSLLCSPEPFLRSAPPSLPAIRRRPRLGGKRVHLAKQDVVRRDSLCNVQRATGNNRGGPGGLGSLAQLLK